MDVNGRSDATMRDQGAPEDRRLHRDLGRSDVQRSERVRSASMDGLIDVDRRDRLRKIALLRIRFKTCSRESAKSRELAIRTDAEDSLAPQGWRQVRPDAVQSSASVCFGGEPELSITTSASSRFDASGSWAASRRANSLGRPAAVRARSSQRAPAGHRQTRLCRRARSSPP